MYHARISIFKIDGAKKEKEKEKKRRYGREDTADKKEDEGDKGEEEKKTDTRRSDVAERDLGRPGSERLVSRPQLIVQSKRNV